MLTFTVLKAFILHKRTRFIVKLIIPLCVFYYYFTILDLTAIKHFFSTINIFVFVLSFAVLCLRNFIGAMRSSILLKYKQLSYSIHVLTKYYFIGNFFNLILPTLVGRDIARGYYLYNSSSGKKEVISSIVVERFIGTIALMLVSLCSYVIALIVGIDVTSNDYITFIIIAFSLGCVFILLFFNTKTEQFIERLIPTMSATKLRIAVTFIHDVISYHKAPIVLWYTLLTSIGFQFVGVVSTYLIACSLESTIPFTLFLILLPVIWVAGMIPVSIGGLGVREASFLLLFSTVGMSEEMAMTVCLLWNAQNIGLGMIGGLFVMLERNSAARTKKALEDK